MKEIIIINGCGGVGKDTFVDFLTSSVDVAHTSIVQPAKWLAQAVGWTGTKSEKDRKFLADLKTLIDDYSDANYKFVAAYMREFQKGGIDAELFCIDMREKKDIDRARKEFGAKAVLITRDSVSPIESNHADANVHEIEYDYTIKNDGSLDDLKEAAKEFVTALSGKQGDL